METQAINKITEEFNDKSAQFSQKGKAVSTYVVGILKDFCQQNSEFAQAIVQSDKTVVDCINVAVRNAGNSISDLDVCKKAVEFYFPDATVHFAMKIDVGDGGFSNNESAQCESPQATAPQKTVDVCLDSLLDF